MYTCNQCGYNTNIKCNYIRHLQKKVKCGKKASVKVYTGSEKVNENSVKVNNDSVKVNIDSVDVNSGLHQYTYEEVDDNHVKCINCLKILTKKQFVYSHKKNL